MTEDIVATLRLWENYANEQGLTDAVDTLKAAADEIERLRDERDEARREWCRLWGDTQGRNVAPTQAARLRAWDCFKKGKA
jgi:hypothetical protein